MYHCVGSRYKLYCITTVWREIWCFKIIDDWAKISFGTTTCSIIITLVEISLGGANFVKSDRFIKSCYVVNLMYMYVARIFVLLLWCIWIGAKTVLLVIKL